MSSSDVKQPLVSIILPTYNRAAFILETIQSIRKQTYDNWELIILDDGSEDNTLDVVKSVSDERIRYYNDGRIGITGVLKNKGISIAQGEFVAFMDSDDLWADNKLALQVSALQQYPDAGFSFTNGHNFSNKGVEAIFYNKQAGIEKGNFFERICEGSMGVFLQSVVVKRKHLDTDMLFRENRRFTDFSFITNLAYGVDAVVFYEQLFYRRIHSANNMSFNWAEDYEEHIKTVSRYKKEKKLSGVKAKQILFLTYIHFGEEYIKYGDKRMAISCFLTALRYNISIIPIKKIFKTIF